MEAKFTKDEMKWLENNAENLIDYAGKIIDKLRYVYPKKYIYVSADYLGEVTDEYVTIHDSDGDFIEIPVEYFHDNDALADLEERYLDKIKEEEERTAYFRKLAEEKEQSELRRLMKKYPTIVKRYGDE